MHDVTSIHIAEILTRFLNCRFLYENSGRIEFVLVKKIVFKIQRNFKLVRKFKFSCNFNNFERFCKLHQITRNFLTQSISHAIRHQYNKIFFNQ